MSTTITIEMSERDFERLTQTSAPWRESLWEQRNRYEAAEDDRPPYAMPSHDWATAHWVKDAAALILARAYLAAAGHRTESWWDMVALEYMILTDAPLKGADL